MLTDPDFTDVTLVFGDNRQIPVHRAVLSAASLFFRQLLYESLNQKTFLYLGGFQYEELLLVVD